MKLSCRRRRRPRLARTRSVLLVALVVGAGGRPGAAADSAAAYPREGARAERDLYTPAAIVVVDAAATADVASRTGELLPLVVRRTGPVAAPAVEAFTAAFQRTHASFLDALEREFGTRAPDPGAINTDRFRAFHRDFQAANPLLPVNLLLAESWAKGYDGEPVRERLASALRGVLGEHLVADLRPASTLFLVDLAPEDRISTWGEAAAHARILPPAEVLSAAEAARAVERSLDSLDRTAGGFLARFVRPNVAADDYLTGLLLRERLGERAQSRRFVAGSPLVRAGEPVDHWAALALLHLERMHLPPVTEPPPAAAALAAASGAGPAVGSGGEAAGKLWRLRWFWIAAAGLLGGGAALGCVAARRRRQRRDRGQWLEPRPPVEPERLREALLPHLARELKNRLVHALFTQRQELLHNEEAASQRIADLEERLARLQPAIAERIRGYERRIRQLEGELEEKDQETRDLIRAKLVLARRELDAEISRHRVDWN